MCTTGGHPRGATSNYSECGHIYLIADADVDEDISTKFTMEGVRCFKLVRFGVVSPSCPLQMNMGLYFATNLDLSLVEHCALLNCCLRLSFPLYTSLWKITFLAGN